MKLHWKNTNSFVQVIASYLVKKYFRCKNKIFVKNVDSVKNQKQGQETDEEALVTDDLSFEEACSLVNQSLEIFDCSPLKNV